MTHREPAPRPQPQLQKTPPNGRGPGAVALATEEPPTSPPPAAPPQQQDAGCLKKLVITFTAATAICLGYSILKDFNTWMTSTENTPTEPHPSAP